jgi:hypothetical protein
LTNVWDFAVDSGYLDDDWDPIGDINRWRLRVSTDDPCGQYLAALEEYEDLLNDQIPPLGLAEQVATTPEA